MEDFVVNARNLSVGAGRNKHLLKEAEIYFQSARRNRSTETFAICIQVLLTSGREGSSSVKAPENIVAAQTLCWICKHNQLSEEQFSSLVAALRWQVGVGTNHPVTVQLTAAISAAIVIAHVPSENWLGNSLQLMLEVLHSNSDAQQRWVYCVVSIVGCVPEVAASKDVICTINDQKCAQWTNNLSLSALAQQIVKGVCIHQSVLHQSAVVDQMLNMALSSTSVGDSELLAACLRCCVFWVEFAASALQSLPGDCESAEVLQVLELQCTSAVRSLALWTSSTVLTAATDLLLHSSGNHSNAVEACVELLVALCTALSSDTEAQASAVCKGGGSKLQQQASSSSAPNSGRKKTAKASIRSNSGSSQQAALVALSGSIRGELRCMKHNLTQQLLPVLAASLATQAQSLQALHSALATQKQHQHQQQQQQVQEGGWLCDVEGALNTCLTVFRGNCECISALLNPPFSEILAGNHSDLSTLTPLAQLWVQYLTSFSESVRSHTDAFSEMSKLDTLADVWEEIDPLRQLLTMLLPVATALAEHLPVSPSAAPQDSSSSVSCGEVDSLRAQLTALVHGLVEGAVVAAVTAAAYPEPPVVNLRSTSADWGSAAAVSLFTPKQSLQEQENLEDYRNYVRDSLRSLVVAMPNLSTWLLRHTHDAVQGYVTAVQARIAATPKTSAKATAASHVFEAAELGAGWAVAEALLHAVSAVTKLILTCLKAKPAPASEDLFCALLHLLRLLSNTDTVCACRPLSRICAVLYGEFAPVLLEHGALDVCFAMVRALLLSLQHPEAPFKVHCQQQQGGDGRQSVAVSLPGSLGGLLVPHNLHLFSFSSLSSATPTGSTNSASTNGSNKRLLDLLCLQGSCSLPFRVKQDHIGAVALLKVVSTLYSSSSSGGGGGGSFSNSPPSTENALINALPRILCTLKVVHGQAQGSTAHAILLFQQHQQELLSRSPGALPLLLLHYCYFYLTFLQPFSSKDRSLSPKSFHIVFHATLTAVLGGRKGGCYDLVSDIGAIFIPVCVSAMQSIGAKDAVLATQEMCSACTVGDTEVAQAICELSTSICTQCSLAQLLYTVSAIFSAVHGKYKKSPDLHTLQAVVRIIENCAPLLRSLAASAEIRRFSSIELDAVCSLILSCRIELLLPAFSLKAESAAEMSSFAPQAVGALQRVYDTYSLLLQNILRKAGRAELVLPAASSIVRSLCSWYSVVDVREAFQNIVRELSEKGVSIMHNEENRSDGGVGGGGEVSGNINVNIEDIDMRMERGDTQDSGRPRKPGEEQRSLGVLLQLWVSSLAATELLPAVAASNIGGGGGGGGENPSQQQSQQQHSHSHSQTRKLPLDALGESSLQCILSAVCDLFSPLGSTSLPGPGNSFGSGVSATAAVLALSHESWESALAVLALALGPLHVIFTDVSNSGSLFPLSTDGCIAPAALVKAVTCTDAAAGVPSLVHWFLSSGLAERTACALLFALLQSCSDNSSASKSNKVGQLTFPSELRDQCIGVLVKYVLCFGRTQSSALLNAAMTHPACPCNGLIGTPQGKEGWARRLLECAAAGDWKKFKSTSKTLCRG